MVIIYLILYCAIIGIYGWFCWKTIHSHCWFANNIYIVYTAPIDKEDPDTSKILSVRFFDDEKIAQKYADSLPQKFDKKFSGRINQYLLSIQINGKQILDDNYDIISEKEDKI